jgi:hypothetical protein
MMDGTLPHDPDDTDAILLTLGLPLDVMGPVLAEEISELASAADPVAAASYNLKLNTSAHAQHRASVATGASSNFAVTHDPLDSHEIMDPEARSLMKALIAHKVAAIKREDYAEAKLAKQQADVACNIGRRLAALRKLSRANDRMAGMQDHDVDVMDDEAIAGAKRRHLHSKHRSAMQDREADHLRKQLNDMREEALSKSIAVSVAVGLDSFLGRKERDRATLAAKLSYRDGAMGESDGDDGDDDDGAPNEAVLFTNTIMTHDHEVATTRLALERLIHDWIAHGSDGGDTIYPPRLTLSETREYDHLVSVFGLFPVEILLGGHRPSVATLLEALDFQIRFLVEHLGVAQIFRSCVFVLTMVLQPQLGTGTRAGNGGGNGGGRGSSPGLGPNSVGSGAGPSMDRGYSTASTIHAAANSSSHKHGESAHGSSASGVEPPLDGVTAAALHLLRTLYTVHKQSDTHPSELLFDAVDKQRTGLITAAQLRTDMKQNSRCREIVQCRPRLTLLRVESVQDEIMKGYQSERMERDEFVRRVDELLTVRVNDVPPTASKKEGESSAGASEASATTVAPAPPTATAASKTPHPPPPDALTEEQLIARSRRMTFEHEDFDVFDTALSDNTVRIGAVSVLPLLVRKIGASIAWMQPPAACQYAHDPKNQDVPFPIGGPQLFENHNVREFLDCVHHIVLRPGVGVDIVGKICWPASSQAGSAGSASSSVATWGEEDEIEAASLVVLNSLLCEYGFVEGTVLSPATILPLCVERFYHGDKRMRWCAEHIVASTYRLEACTRHTSESLLSLRVPKTKLLKMESRLCHEFPWLMESKRKGDSVANLVASGDDSVKVPEKLQLPVDRVLSFHAPAWALQGAAWPTPESLDQEALQQQAKSLVNKWDGVRSILPSKKKADIPLHEKLAANMFRTAKLESIGRTEIGGGQGGVGGQGGGDGAELQAGTEPATTETPQPPPDLEAAAAAAAEEKEKEKKKGSGKKKKKSSRGKSMKGGEGLKRGKSEKKKKKKKKSKSMSRKKSKAKIAPAGM